MERIICIIPARLNSSRLHKKILCDLQGKPLIQWTWEAASAVSLFDSVVIAVDAPETAALVRSFGADYVMSSENCSNGTMRIAEVIDRYPVKAEIIVNWQGDEPFLSEEMIAKVVSSISEEKSDIWTLKKRIELSEASSPDLVKVVTNQEGYALYFSRAPIPYIAPHTSLQEVPYYRHIGLYAYRKSVLQKLRSLPVALLSEIEQLEQLTFLYYGWNVKVHETHLESLSIDTFQDLERASLFLTKK